MCSNDTDPVIGTTSISFTQFSGAGSIVAGTGLSKSGNTLNLDVNSLTLVTAAAGDTIAIADISDNNSNQKS